MKSKSKVSLLKTRKFWIILVVIILVGAGGGYYYFQNQQTKIVAQADSSSVQTAQVTQADLTLSAQATGSLVSGQTANLGFLSSGTVAAVNVQVGQQVKKGQDLADLGDLQSLQADVATAQANLTAAQTTLQNFKDGAAKALGNAQLTVATDQSTLATAQAALKTQGEAPCDKTTTDAYYQTYLLEKANLDKMDQSNSHSDYYLSQVVPEKILVNKDYQAYLACSSYTAYQISSSQANLAIAQATLKTDQATLAKLQQNSGVDPDQLAQDQESVDSAQLALTNAQKILAGATLTAPFDGTVITIAGKAGDNVTDSSTFITLEDLAHPQIQFYADETDLDKVAVGKTTTVVFDAYPDQTFTGKITQVDPQLVTVSGSQAIEGLVTLDSTAATSKVNLLVGLNCSVNIIGAQAKNALLVPLQALHDLGGGQYAVFVIDATGKPKLQLVTIGIQNLVDVQITSGVQVGQYVSTGLAQVK
ncbi:MAG: efflux RND transporter periplasmic adaptor subunit [Anaerolineaceae bacterium]|nr:efflux RND transporter periplasmic adaptor subunit [Anaerolineaceae bacterium]